MVVGVYIWECTEGCGSVYGGCTEGCGCIYEGCTEGCGCISIGGLHRGICA